MRYTLLAFFFIISASCTTSVSRRISSIEEDFQVEQILSEVDILASAKFKTSLQCQQISKRFHNTLYRLDPSSFKLKTLSDEKISHLIKKSFRLRIKLKSIVSNISEKKEVYENCLTNIKKMQRSIRYLEDYLIESRIYMNKSFKTLVSEGDFFQKNPEFNFNSYQDLKSGDVILSRGNAYSSTAIAQIGEEHAQFSHLSFVYVDQSGEIYTTEAHIEVGVFVSQIEQNINQKNARSVVLRHKNSALAHYASKLIFEKVQMKSLKEGNIPYDFKMDSTDSSTLFKSELISHGFSLATENRVQVPFHRTKIQNGIETFLSQLGIKYKQNQDVKIFSVEDIILDKNFDIVSEWRNPNRIRNSREKDAIISKLIEWMKDDNYKLHPSGSVKNYTNWVLKRLPWMKKGYEQKFPFNMSNTQLKTFMVLDRVATNIHKKLKIKTSTLGYSPGFSEVNQMLEEIKDEDLVLYKKSKKKEFSFHRYCNNF